MQEGKPKVFVDSREPAEVCDAIEAAGVDIEICQLEIGDYQISDRLVVERKTRGDFESSIIDGRLFKQISQLSSSVERAVLVVEGSPDCESRISRAALLGAYCSIISDFGCSLFFTRSPSSTAELICALALHERSKKQPLSVFAKRKALSQAAQQRAIVEALPNVGPKLARALLRYFQTVENVMSAPESELRQVGKIGQKKARQLRQILASRYKEEEDAEYEGSHEARKNRADF
ncbi:MAG: helix-hairpin-helix domain-containing protein [Candidatus Micrarchaeota archaeon]|nr:helix-hairpin-helix domain-containing protein [Candidatus Micrarchaeota archaeon]